MQKLDMLTNMKHGELSILFGEAWLAVNETPELGLQRTPFQSPMLDDDAVVSFQAHHHTFESVKDDTST